MGSAAYRAPMRRGYEEAASCSETQSADNVVFQVKQMAGLLDISANGLRYLEDEGLVKVRRNGITGYREYDPEAAALLFMYSLYRHGGLELKDITEALSSSPRQAIELLYANVEKKRQQLRVLEKAAQETARRIEMAQMTLGFTVVTRPALRCFLPASFSDESAPMTPDRIASAAKAWIDQIPYTFSGMVFRPQTTGYQHLGCFFMDAEWSDDEISPLPFAVTYPERTHCLRCVWEFGEPPDADALMDVPTRWANEHDLLMADEDVLVQYVYLQKNEADVLYKAVAWVPLEADGPA